MMPVSYSLEMLLTTALSDPIINARLIELERRQHHTAQRDYVENFLNMFEENADGTVPVEEAKSPARGNQAENIQQQDGETPHILSSIRSVSESLRSPALPTPPSSRNENLDRKQTRKEQKVHDNMNSFFSLPNGRYICAIDCFDFKDNIYECKECKLGSVKFCTMKKHYKACHSDGTISAPTFAFIPHNKLQNVVGLKEDEDSKVNEQLSSFWRVRSGRTVKVDDFVTFEDGKYACKLCNHLYCYFSAMKTHVKKNHSNELLHSTLPTSPISPILVETDGSKNLSGSLKVDTTGQNAQDNPLSLDLHRTSQHSPIPSIEMQTEEHDSQLTSVTSTSPELPSPLSSDVSSFGSDKSLDLMEVETVDQNAQQTFLASTTTKSSSLADVNTNKFSNSQLGQLKQKPTRKTRSSTVQLNKTDKKPTAEFRRKSQPEPKKEARVTKRSSRGNPVKLVTRKRRSVRKTSDCAME